MMVRRLISSCMDFLMLNFSFEFHTVLWDFDKKKILMLILLCLRRSVRFLCFLLEEVLELKIRARDET